MGHRLRGVSGFTLVELVTVLVLIGIVAVVAVPRFADTRGFDETGYQLRFISALRTMQQRAMQDTRDNWGFQVNLLGRNAFGPPTLDYTGDIATTNNADVINIDGDADFITATAAQMDNDGVSFTVTRNGVLISSAAEANIPIAFDPLGRALFNDVPARFVVTFVGDSQLRVCVESQGYIHGC